MIKIVAKQIVKQDRITDFIAISKKLVHETLKSDAGCISYGLFQSLEHSNILTFIEEWENQELLDRHMASQHFKKLFPELEKLLDVPAEIAQYQKIE